MFKYSDLNYDDFYSSQHCKKENAEIRRVLDSVCGDDDTVLDLGAGTGLVASMLEKKCYVVQVEKDPAMKLQNPYPNFMVADAYDLVEEWATGGHTQFDHVVSVFALNYMRVGTLTFACKIARGACVFVVYDKPYMRGSSSFYTGKKMKFLRKCWFRQRTIELELAELARSGRTVTVSSLLGEPYYKVVLVK